MAAVMCRFDVVQVSRCVFECKAVTLTLVCALVDGCMISGSVESDTLTVVYL